MDTPDLDRLTLLEQAQLLHDATLRRHGELLDQHAETMVALRAIQERQQAMLDMLTGLVTQQQALLEHQQQSRERHQEHLDLLTQLAAQHQERMDRLQQTLDAIKDMLDRGNGH